MKYFKLSRLGPWWWVPAVMYSSLGLLAGFLFGGEKFLGAYFVTVALCYLIHYIVEKYLIRRGL
jgi:hypothetical protein